MENQHRWYRNHRWIQLLTPLTLKISNDNSDGDLPLERHILVISRACITVNSQKINLIARCVSLPIQVLLHL